MHRRPRRFGGAFVLSWGWDAAALALALARAELARDDLTLGHECPRCASSSHGRPVLLDAAGREIPNAHVSLSRCGDFSVAVFSRHLVGVDVQGVDDADATLASVVLHPAERTPDASLTRVWVLKEALLKALGTGLATDPREIRLGRRGTRVVSGPGRGARLSVRRVSAPGPDPRGPYLVAVAVLPSGGSSGR